MSQLDLIGKTITNVELKGYDAGGGGAMPDYCDEINVTFSDGSSLRLVGESSQDMGYIEMTLRRGDV